jgi:glucose-6-phosphate 1-epimerase
MDAITLAPFGELPAVHLTAADGAEAIVTLFGAHLVSWKSADGRQRLFCSAGSALDGSRAIRGGVPVIFPQFNERGPGMRHGFARVSDWALIDSGSVAGGAFAVFALEPHDLSDERAAAWPYDFALRLRVEVGGADLAMTLEVENCDVAPFSFSSALHTYHLVDDVAAVRIDGLGQQPLAIGDTLDEIFVGVAPRLVLHSGAGTLQLEQDGFTDAVVWNPGAANTAAMPDMQDDDYKRFVCIEPAVIEPLTLQAGETWSGRYRIAPSSIP